MDTGAASTHTSHGFYAWYNKMPGADDPVLHVTLLCECPTSGYTVTLEPGNEGPLDIPRFVALRLVVTPPAVDDPVLEVITSERVLVELDETDVELVRVDGVDTAGGRSVYIPVATVY